MYTAIMNANGTIEYVGHYSPSIHYLILYSPSSWSSCMIIFPGCLALEAISQMLLETMEHSKLYLVHAFATFIVLLEFYVANTFF